MRKDPSAAAFSSGDIHHADHNMKTILDSTALQIWTNHSVPPNDGGISLGQAALAAFERFDEVLQDNTKSGAN